MQSLLRPDDVALVVWRSFQTDLYESVPAKSEADDALRASADGGDVRASEWESQDGRLLLMLEHFC